MNAGIPQQEQDAIHYAMLLHDEGMPAELDFDVDHPNCVHLRAANDSELEYHNEIMRNMSLAEQTPVDSFIATNNSSPEYRWKD